MSSSVSRYSTNIETLNDLFRAGRSGGGAASSSGAGVGVAGGGGGVGGVAVGGLKSSTDSTAHSDKRKIMVDLVRRLETQKIIVLLMRLQHSAEMLLASARVDEMRAQHEAQLRAWEDEAEMLRQQVESTKAKMKRLKETATGRTITALASELAVARGLNASR